MLDEIRVERLHEINLTGYASVQMCFTFNYLIKGRLAREFLPTRVGNMRYGWIMD